MKINKFKNKYLFLKFFLCVHYPNTTTIMDNTINKILKEL